MGAARSKPSDDLTTAAIAERASRQILAGVKDLVRAEIAAATLPEWLDQKTSPLGREKHLRLAREGKLPSRKEGRQVLVHRDDINAYIKSYPERGKRVEDEDVDDIVDTIVKGGRKR